MPIPIYTYPLDPTGTNANNLVQGEVHTLSARPIRVLAPNHGAFYTDSVIVRDHITNAILVKGTQYECVQLHQVASLKFGKNVCTLIIIKDQDVHNKVRIQYQVVGGEYSDNSANIIAMYEAVANDNRTIDWINITDKPLEYPPSLHNQLLSSVYGFEPVVDALERLRQALILTNVPAFEELIDWINTTIAGFPAHIQNKNNPHEVTKAQVGLGLVDNLPVVTEDQILAGEPVNAYMTFERFLQAIEIYGGGPGTYSLTPSNTSVTEGYGLTFVFIGTSIANGAIFYWEVVHGTTANEDFTSTSGSFSVTNNQGSFDISTVNNGVFNENKSFQVRVRKDNASGSVLKITDALTLKDAGELVDGISDIMKAMVYGCINQPGINRNPTTLSTIGNLSDAKRTAR